jgi:hypothetical protein
MKPRILLLMLLASTTACLTAQQRNPNPDSKQEGRTWPSDFVVNYRPSPAIQPALAAE